MTTVSNPSLSTTATKPASIRHKFQDSFQALALIAGMQLDLFTPLKDGPLDAAALAEALGFQEEMLSPLLYSLAAADLLTVDQERFANTEEADRFLVRGRPEYLGGLAALYTVFWTAALKTADSVRSGKPQARFDFSSLPEEELLAYFKKQVHSSLSGGREIVAKFDFSGCTRLLDAGGGTGGVAIALCEKFPNLTATVADLPVVARLTGTFIAEAGMSERIDVSPTDLCSAPPAGNTVEGRLCSDQAEPYEHHRFCGDAWPLRGYDVAVLRAVIQTLSLEEGRAALKNIGQAMSPGGRIFIFGSVLKNSRLAPSISVTNNLVFLNVYDHGRSYTEDEYRDMLTQAGFEDITIEHEVLADGMGLIYARKA